MTCTRVLVETSPQKRISSQPEYATRWTLDAFDHTPSFFLWPTIAGLQCSVLDVLTRQIRPHRYQRYADGWQRIGKSSSGRTTKLLHVNGCGYIVKEEERLLGIPTLLVDCSTGCLPNEFEEFAWFAIDVDESEREPIKFGQSSLRHEIIIEGQKQLATPMQALANAACYDFLSKRKH